MHGQNFLSFFCTWKSREMTSVWVGKKYMPNESAPMYQAEYYGAKHITTNKTHPVPGRDSSPCVTTGNGLWREKIYHFLPDKPPSSAGEEIQTEYFVRYDDFLEVIEKLYENRRIFQHLVQVTEIRMVAADNMAMSPAKTDGKTKAFIGVHFTWFRKHDQIVKALPQIEKILEPYTVRPHFGKIFSLSGPKFEELFGEDLNVLRSLIVHHDPEGKFRNEFMDKYLFSNSRWNGIVRKPLLAKL